MSSRIVLRGKHWWGSRDFRVEEQERARRAPGTPWAKRPNTRLNEPGALVQVGAVPADSAQSPFRAGSTFFCPEDKISYRVLKKLDPTEGWAPSEFWQQRWRIKHRDVLVLVECGLLDAAMVEGSQVRRYRCRDERLVLKSDVLNTAEAYRERMLARFKGKRPRRKKEPGT